MNIRRRITLVSVFAAAAILVAAVMLSGWRGKTTPSGDPELERVLFDPNTRLDQALKATGFPARFVDIFSSATTEVVSSSNGQHHLVQRIPSLSLRREVRIAIHTGKQLTPGARKAVRTAAGFDVYPLHHSVIRFDRGYDRYQAFFVANDALSPELLDQLGLQRQAARRSWNVLPVVHAQSSAVLGMVIASVTTTTADSGGVGDTFRPAPEGGMESGATHPGAPPAEPREGTVPVEVRRQQYLDEHYDGSLDEYARQYEENARRFEESLDSDARARLQQETADPLRSLEQGNDPFIETRAQREARLTRELTSTQAEIEAGNRLRWGETLAEREARVRYERALERTRQWQVEQYEGRLQRAGNALAILQALAEWMQQALDFGEWDRQLAAAEACLEQRAQNAGPAERANIEQVRAHLEAARSDLNWNTGVRVANSGNTAASAAVPAGLIAGGVFGLASSGNNAGLRDLTAQSVSDALRAVGNCDPPPCAEPPRDGPPTQELNYTPAEQQNHTPGPDQRPESACRERWTGSTRLTIPEGPTLSAGLVWEYTETHGSLVSYKAQGELSYTPPATQSGCRVVSVTPRIHQLAAEDAFLTVDTKSLEYSTSGASGWPATECIQCSYDRQPRCNQTMVGGLWLQGSGLAVRSGNGMTIRESAPFMGGTLSYTFEHR
jgi:hypothetical protein